MCDNLLKFLKNQQQDGGSSVEKMVTGLLEKSCKGITDGHRMFIAVDSHEAVKVGTLRQGVKSFQVVRPKFTEDFPEAVVREGADELTLRAEGEGVRRNFMDTTNVEDHRWGPPLVDADGHAICQAIYQGIEGQEWEAMCYHYKELHQAVRTKKPGDNQKAMRTMKVAKKDREE